MQFIILALILGLCWQLGHLVSQADFVYLILASGLFFWLLILPNWQRGVYLFLLYLPFAGMFSIRLYQSKLPLLFKDILFVLPAYLSFFMSWRILQRENVEIPRMITGSMVALGILVIIQIFNPRLSYWMVGAIGAKVWLFYLPLTFLAYAMIEEREDLTGILKLMVVVSWIPCLIGIFLWISSMKIGYLPTLYKFYGGAPIGADAPNVGGGVLFYRIPSTFTYATQYAWYTISMVVPALMLMRLAESRRWQYIATGTLGLVALASFLSGARATLLFVPVMLFLAYWIEGKATRMLKPLCFLGIIFTVMYLISHIHPGILFNVTGKLTSHNISNASFLFVSALKTAPLGAGAGMSTNAARHGLAETDPERSQIYIENYYGKTVFELGIPGLIIVGILFSSLLLLGYRTHSAIRDDSLKGCSSALLAFIIIVIFSSIKGAPLDIDPVNIYFWFFTGLLFKLEALDRSYDHEDELSSESRPMI